MVGFCILLSHVFVQVSPAVVLSSMNTDAVCERLKQIDGIDSSMMAQYTSTIKKVRLLTCFFINRNGASQFSRKSFK